MRIFLADIFEALEFAAYRHRMQKRKGAGGIPYINHPIEVTSLIIKKVQEPSKEILIASLLHDLLEDTNTSPEEIREKFGEKVLKLVEEVTDDMSLSRKKRKALQVAHAGNLSEEGAIIKFADKCCNIKDIVTTRFFWSRREKIDYIQWAGEVIAHMSNPHKGLMEVYLNNLSEAEEILDHKFNISF